MVPRGCHGTRLTALAAGLMVQALVTGCHAGTVNKQVPPEQQKRFDAMRAEGTQAPLTVFPVQMGEHVYKDAAEVVALLLEKAGMTNLAITDAEFQLPKDATFDQAPELFGEFIRKNPPETEYALYAQFVGGPKTGAKEIRGVIVDRSGKAVWVDRQTAADRAFRRAKLDCPLECCEFLVERVRTQLGIPRSARDDSGKGKFARMFAANSPGPGEAERSAMKERLAAMRQAGASATVAVYPVRLADDKVGDQDATHLATLLNEKKLCRAEAVESPLRVRIQPSRNEQKTLWDLARAFKDYVKQNPPEADYALLADYIMVPGGKRAWEVHFVVCDRKGDWVIVDFQNDHHADFQSVDPKSYDDCGRLVARRLKEYLR